MVILDTDHVSLLQREGSPESDRLRSRMERIPVEEIGTTIISFEEQTRGWLAYRAQARSPEQEIEAYRRLNKHLDDYRTLRVLDFDEAAASRFQQLKKARLRIGMPDLRIAAIVLARDDTLLSRNLSDFRNVPGLKVEDWAAE